MSNTMSIMFGGLLHFVENENKDKAVKMCVVLPEAPGHHAVIRADLLSRLVDSDGGAHSGVNIDGKRVYLRFSRETATERSMDFEGPVVSGDPKGVVPMEDIAGRNADRNPAIVSDKIDTTIVRSQILLTEGSFSVPASDPAGLELPDRKRINIAGFITMTVSQVVTAEVVLTDLADSAKPEEVYKIEGINIEGSIPGLRIVYLCRDKAHNVNDLDEDFAYHYQLLLPENKAAVLKGEHLPRIVKLTKASADDGLWSLTPKGCNCAPSRGLSRPFDLDVFATDASKITAVEDSSIESNPTVSPPDVY